MRLWWCVRGSGGVTTIIFVKNEWCCCVVVAAPLLWVWVCRLRRVATLPTLPIVERENFLMKTPLPFVLLCGGGAKATFCAVDGRVSSVASLFSVCLPFVCAIFVCVGERLALD